MLMDILGILDTTMDITITGVDIALCILLLKRRLLKILMKKTMLVQDDMERMIHLLLLEVIGESNL